MRSLFCVAILLTLAGASPEPASAQAPSSPAANSANAARQLRAFLTIDWKYWMAQDPEDATAFGYPGQNAHWPDLSPAAIEGRKRHLEKELADMKAIPRNQLPAGEQLNYDLYLALLERAQEGVRFHDESIPMLGVVPVNLYMPINQMQGLLSDVPSTISQMPAEHPSDYQDILARLNAIPAFVDQTLALMREGMAHGWTPPKITMRDVAQQAASQIVPDPMASPLLAAFKKYPDTFSEAQKSDFTAKAKAAYLEKVSPAFAKLRDFLAQTYVPACRDSIPVTGLPDGADYYRYLVRWQTTTNLTPAQIHDVGLQQVKELGEQIAQVAAQSGYAGRTADFENFMRTDPQFVATKKEDLLMVYRDAAKRADPQLTYLFGKLPRLTYGVRAVPDAIAPSETDAYYEQGSPAAGRPGYLYVNTYKLEERPKWEAEDTILHEGVPGHHLQFSLAQEMEGVPEFRQQLSYSAYAEGWALYSESLGTEMGFYTDPYMKYGYLSGMMWRAVRLVVDTGMHSTGWSRDQAISYFSENTGLPMQTAIAEIDRYIVWPGQALAYKTGQLKIRELRTRAEKELGTNFNVRAFHDTVVDEGALPLDLLEKRVNEWIGREKAKAPKPTGVKPTKQ